MPLYDFQCEDCQATFEELVRSSEDTSAVRCAKCGSARVVRQLAIVAAGSARGSAQADSSGSPKPRPSGGCGSGCGCHH